MNPGGGAEIAWPRLLRQKSAGQFILWSVTAVFMLAAHAAAGWWVLREKPAELASDSGPAFAVELVGEMQAPEGPVEQIAMDQTDAPETEGSGTERTEPAEPQSQAEDFAPEPPDAPPEREIAEPPAVAVDPLLPEEVEPALNPELAVNRLEIEEPDVAMLPDEMEVLPSPRPQTPGPRRKSPAKQEAKPRDVSAAAPSRQQSRSQAKTAAPASSAPAARAERGNASAAATARWQARLMKHLERRKRYPAEARRAKRQGEAQVRFTIDASGNVGSVALTRSSGVPELDAEVVAMVRRASPVPAPPPGVGHTIDVPIRFSLR